MSTSDPFPASGAERSQDDETQQWEEYLCEKDLWDHFLSFAPETLQWTYNVQ